MASNVRFVDSLKVGQYKGEPGTPGTDFSGSFTGSFTGSGEGDFTGSFTGSFEGSGALTGSFTGSFVGDGSGLTNLNVNSGSWDGIFSGSAQITGSLGVTGSVEATNFTGSSFTGSFVGDGSGLTNLPISDPFPFTGSAQITGSLGVTGSVDVIGDITSIGNISIDTTSTITPSLLITSTNDTSDASPILELKRNSSSPSNGDYLGQIKFKGENDADQEIVYAKITGKISDNTDTTEDGLIEFATKQNGSNVINARLTGTDLKLINGTGLEVDNNISASGDIIGQDFTGSSFTGSFVGDGSGLTNLPIDSGSWDGIFTGSAQITGSLGLTGSITTDILEFNNDDGDLATQFFYDPIDVGTFIQTNITFDLIQDAQPQGIFFKPDGLKMYMVGRGGDDLYEYDLTTAWDITTLTFNQNIAVIDEANPYDVFFSPDGFYFYIVGSSEDSVRQYDVSTAWDISTVTSDFELAPLPYSTGNLPNPVNVNFKPDGTLMFVGDNNVELIVTYELSTPWDISTASFLSEFSTVNIPSTGTTIPTISITTMFGLRFSDDGTSIFITDNTKDTIYQLDLSTAWDPTTSTFNSKTYRSTVITDENQINGIFVAENAKKTFVSSLDSDLIRQINMGGLIVSSSNGEESTSIALKGGLNVSQDIISNQYLISNNLSVDSNSYLYGGLTTYTNAALCQAAQGTVSLLAGTVYNGPSRVDIQKSIFWGVNGSTQSNQYSTRAHNLNLIRSIAGPRVRLNIGVYATGSNDDKPHSGIIDIKSLAQTFSHSGSLDIGRTLKVEGKADYELYNLSSATQIFLDNFIETGASAVNLDAHTPDVGIGWTKSLTNPSGNTRNLQVQPNSDGIVQISGTVTSQGLIYTCDTLPTSVNYELTTTFRRQDSADDTFHLIVKYVDNDNFYFLTWSASHANCQLRKIEGGVVTRVTDISQNTSTPFSYGVFSTTSDNLSPEMLLKLRFIDNKLMVWNGTTSDFVFRGSFQVDSDFNDGDGGVFHRFGIAIGAIYAGSIDDQTTNWKLSSFQVNNLGPVNVLDDATVNYINSGSFGIGTTSPNASSVLDITSTTKGILLPRMTTTEINAISPLTEGLTAYNTTLNTMCFYNGTEWRQVSNTTM